MKRRKFYLLGACDVPNPSSISKAQIDIWEKAGIVHYLGQVEDVREFIASACCVVLPSFYKEGVPRSLLEAMAMGKPIITTNIAGARECVAPPLKAYKNLLVGQNGILIPPKDTQSLTNAICLLTKARIREMGKRGRIYALKHFHIKHTITQYIQAIQECTLPAPYCEHKESSLESPKTPLVYHSEHCEETQPELLATPLLCHHERSEESLPESLVAKRDSSVVSLPQNDKITTFTRNPKSNASQKTHRDSSPLAGVQNDNESNPQDKITLQRKLVCHSELSQESEESLLSTKDSLKESLENLPLCHHEPSIKGEELLSKTPKSTTSDSDRDSSGFTSPQNDNGIESARNPSSNSSLRTRYDKLTTFTRNPKSNSSVVYAPARADNNPTHTTFNHSQENSNSHSKHYEKSLQICKPTIAFVSNTAQAMYNFRLQVLRALSKDFHIAIIAPFDESKEKLQKEGFSIYHLPLNARSLNPFKDMRTLYSLHKLLNTLQPKLVFNYTIKPAIYSSWLCNLKGITNITLITGLGYVFIEGSWRKALLRAIVCSMYKHALKGTKKVWFLNNDDMGEFLNRKLITQEQAFLLHSEGVDCDYFSPRERPKVKESKIQQNKIKEDEEFAFLLIARMLWDKGVGEFVEAARILQQEAMGGGA
ncbi:glycosyltransferase [Helicobacter marmotae]|uniref:glycosyltransferase n=1 Tax=Helicobacter marmotae TaxID=152490 RepID=UPI000CF0BFFA|nr:glycosyltransferase [Helicobacter marmotae]